VEVKREIEQMAGLSKAGAAVRDAGISLDRVRLNGIPLDQLSELEQWAFDLGYREAAHMAEFSRSI
jgi:hypothetical protein